jgi:uncharacterized Zn-binding protein involved in type VI secretion
MKKGIIVKGDPLSGGGQVIEGTGYEIDGFNIALVGDPVSCSVPFHGGGNIIEGDEGFLIDGKPVALHGHKVSCGCTLISAKLVGFNYVDIPEKESSSSDDKDFLSKGLDKLFNKLDEIVSPEYKEKLCLINENLNASEGIGSLPGRAKIKMNSMGPSYGKEFVKALTNSWCGHSKNSETNKENIPPPALSPNKTSLSSKPSSIPEKNESQKPKKIIRTQSGKKGNWNNELNNPEPNTIYIVDDRYTYETDQQGRTASVEGDLISTGSRLEKRNKTLQPEVGASGGRGKDAKGVNLDDGGHLVGNRFGGAGEKVNLVPQDRNSNRGGGKWKKVEDNWESELKAESKVKVKIEPKYLGDSKRPHEFKVTEKIIDKYGVETLDEYTLPN